MFMKNFIKMTICYHGFCKYILRHCSSNPGCFQGTVFIGLNICFGFQKCLHTCQTPSQYGHPQIFRRRPQRRRRQRLGCQVVILAYRRRIDFFLLCKQYIPKRAKFRLEPCVNVTKSKQRSMHKAQISH